MCGTSLTASRKKTGYVKPKGVKAIGFAAWDSDNLITATNNTVSALPVGIEIYQFEVKNTADVFTETGNKDKTTMTGEKTGSGTFALMYCDRIKNIGDAQALLDGVWNMFLVCNDNSIRVVGIENGADIISVVESTDAQGFLFTTETIEQYFSPELDATAKTAYSAALVASA